MTTILGIDPGSQHTGVGLIHTSKKKITHIAHDIIHTKGGALSERLHFIFEKICMAIETHRPARIAIEEVFIKRNVQSALKLGQARSAALIAAAKYHIPVYEYSARTIKKTIAGYGAADKSQMQYMVRLQLQLPITPPADAADALAIAMCDSC